MSIRRPILVFEYLLADPAAWRVASESMRGEATAMLTAILYDFERLSDYRPVLLLSSEAARRLSVFGCLNKQTDSIVFEGGPTEWLSKPTRVPDEFAASFIIAPETDGILVSLLRQLQSGPWIKSRSLNVPWTMAQIFADKYQTFLWLREQRIRTPATKSLNDAALDSLCEYRVTTVDDRCDQTLPTSTRIGIIKPRDGAGSDGISLVPMSESQFIRRPETCFGDDPWIIQRFIPGIPCSVGFIGGGPSQETIILPPAQQQMRLIDSRPRYGGGQIPCDPEIAIAVAMVAGQIAEAMGSFSGYIGADMVVTRDEHGVVLAHVIEINPRLCTSYIGYRALAEENLAACLAQSVPCTRLRWKQGVAQFDASGKVHLL